MINLNDTTHEPRTSLPRCSLHEGAPEVRHELENGFAQNDNLPGPELPEL